MPAMSSTEPEDEAESNLVKTTHTFHEKDLDLIRTARRVHFPGVSASFLLRAAIRVGIPAIVADRSKLGTPPIDADSIVPTDPPTYSPKRKPKP